MVERDFVFLRWSHLDANHPFAAFQENVTSSRPSLLWDAASSTPPPKVVLYVSHRWESPENPDPHRHQLSSLIRLRNSVEARLTSQGSHHPIRSDDKKANSIDLLTRFILEQKAGGIEDIALWYDFTCLPQKPRSPDEHRKFKTTLLRLHHLLSSSFVFLISLRWPGDGYRESAWCVYESLQVQHARGATRAIAWHVQEKDHLDMRRQLATESRNDDSRHLGLNDRQRGTLFCIITQALVGYLGVQCMSAAMSYAQRLMGLSLRSAEDTAVVGLRLYLINSTHEDERREILAQLSRCYNRQPLSLMTSEPKPWAPLIAAHGACCCQRCHPLNRRGNPMVLSRVTQRYEDHEE